MNSLNQSIGRLFKAGLILPALLATIVIAVPVAAQSLGSTGQNLINEGTISADTGDMILVGQSVTDNGLLEGLNGFTITILLDN